MTKGRTFHVQFTDGDVVTVCGGYKDKTCETLRDGQWRVSHTLHVSRHVSAVWTAKDASYVIGGMEPQEKTSEGIKSSGRVFTGFALKYGAM